MHNTPRDFFLHFGAFAALYAVAVALATLLFRMIDHAFPDPLSDMYYYSDPYSGPMRFAIASLIILVPIFLYLMRIVQREARTAPERYTLAIRRWLVHITLFVTGATIIGDLIALLNSFLGGELATPFLLKVLILFVITGVIFWYFLLDIRGYWQSREQKSQAIGWVVLGVTIATIITGFFIMGSPRMQREIMLDEQQIRELNTMQQEIVRYWQQNQRLPMTIAELESDITGFYVPTAPEGRTPYEYMISDDLNFSLCATFGVASDAYNYREPQMYGLVGNTGWEHKADHTCFTRTIDPSLIEPVAKPMMQ